MSGFFWLCLSNFVNGWKDDKTIKMHKLSSRVSSIVCYNMHTMNTEWLISNITISEQNPFMTMAIRKTCLHRFHRVKDAFFVNSVVGKIKVIKDINVFHTQVIGPTGLKKKRKCSKREWNPQSTDNKVLHSVWLLLHTVRHPKTED